MRVTLRPVQNYKSLSDGVDWAQAVLYMQGPGVRQLTSRIRIAELGFRAGSGPLAKLTEAPQRPRLPCCFHAAARSQKVELLSTAQRISNDASKASGS